MMQPNPSSLDAIRDFLQLSPTLGTAGQPNAGQFHDIAAEGYQAVINLAISNSPDALANEADLVTGEGMEYIHIPVIWDAPTRENLEHFFAVMDAHKDQKVFVHCARNMRVSAFVFLYRVLRQGMPVETASEDMLQIWDPQENAVWNAFVEAAMGGEG